jgi:hypothetical protein
VKTKEGAGAHEVDSPSSTARQPLELLVKTPPLPLTEPHAHRLDVRQWGAAPPHTANTRLRCQRAHLHHTITTNRVVSAHRHLSSSAAWGPLRGRRRLFPQDFIKKHAPDLGANFEVKYTGGAPPKLRFTNASGPSDVIRIDNWKTADMLAYVQEKLLSS